MIAISSLQRVQCRVGFCGDQKAQLTNKSTVLSSKRAQRSLVVRASNATKSDKDRKNRELVGQIEESLKKSGFDAVSAKAVLKRWEDDVGHEVSADELRKVLIGQSTKLVGLVLFSTLMDVGAAYGSFVAGNYIGAVGMVNQQYGVPAFIIQAIAYTLAGYYAFGAVADVFKLGTLVVAAVSFNLNASAFLEAVEDIAGNASTGLGALDKAVEAVNSVKVLQAINKMSDLLKETGGSSSSPDMLADLGAYLTLEKAQQMGFNASKFGLTDAQAAEIATVFSKFDTNGDGVLQPDEFKSLCGKYTDLDEAEVASAFGVIDLNKDKTISFDEFVKWWNKM